MNQVQKELTFDESVAQVMQTLPPVIRNYLAQEKYTPVTRSLMMKYHLRTDQGGVLEREIMLLLMGIESPAEIIQMLTEEARLDQQTINGIMQDVNEQIFIPIRERMRNAGSNVQQPVRNAAAQPPRPQQQVNAPLPNYTERPSEVRHPAAGWKSPERPLPRPVAAPASIPKSRHCRRSLAQLARP